MKETKKVKEKTLAKEKDKRNLQKKHQEAAGHNIGPPKQTILLRIRLVMDYPLEKMFGCVCFFLIGFS